MEVVYLIVRRTEGEDEGIRFHTGPTIDETVHSINTLRQYHPDAVVNIYTDIKKLYRLPIWDQKRTKFLPIGVEREEVNYKHEFNWERNKWFLPDLRILAAKLDCIVLHPRKAIFLDSDIEVVGPLDEIYEDEKNVWMHTYEYPFEGSHHAGLITNVDWPKWGINPNDVRKMYMINSGVIKIHDRFNPIRGVYLKARDWLLDNRETQTGPGRLKEQAIISVFSQEYGTVKTADHLTNHLWWRRSVQGVGALEKASTWYEKKVTPVV